MPIEKENKYIDCGDYYKGLTARRTMNFILTKKIMI